MNAGLAAIVTVGTELTKGLRIDTNTAEIARELVNCGFDVSEAVSVGDDPESLSRTVARLAERCATVVITGGLGPTHDDVTRQAVAHALGLEIERSERLVRLLEGAVARHRDPDAARQVLNQADVIDGATVIDPTTGTAPGQVVVAASGCRVVLLPGPPTEMRPMLQASLASLPRARGATRELGTVGLSESDAQVLAERALEGREGVGLTVLARPGDVKVLLLDEGAGEAVVAECARTVASALGGHCYSADGASLAHALVDAARTAGITLACAESCTGGMVSTEITAVSGASDVFLGGIVAYSNEVKLSALGVVPGLLAQYGAVSEETVREMAAGARSGVGADVAVAVTGIAGPEGGTPDKPVGLVWFGLATRESTVALSRRFAGGTRESVRMRATAVALDLMRRHALGIPLPR